MNRLRWVAAALLFMILLLGGCTSVPSAMDMPPDLTEMKRFAREQLDANLRQQGLSQYEILGASTVSRPEQSGRFAAAFDVDITDEAGHTRYESYSVLIGLDSDGAMVVLDMGPHTMDDDPLY